MGNWKSLSDDQLWWKSQPGNRGKDVPSRREAKAAYKANAERGSKNFDTLRSWLFKDSDARKQKVEDAVNARRDAGKSIPLEPYVSPKSKDTEDSSSLTEPKANAIPKKSSFSSETVDLGPSDRDPSDYPTNESVGVSLKESKGGKIRLKDCKVSTHKKNTKQPNW